MSKRRKPRPQCPFCGAFLRAWKDRQQIECGKCGAVFVAQSVRLV